MRLIICLIVLGFGFSAVYAGDGDKLNPQYWELLEESGNELNLDIDPEEVTQQITWLVSVDIDNIIKRSGDDYWETRRQWTINRDLKGAEYTEIAWHLLLVLRQLQDAEFIAQRKGIVCLGLKESLKGVNWDALHDVMQDYVGDTNGINERIKTVICLFKLIGLQCFDAEDEELFVEWPQLPSLYSIGYCGRKPEDFSKIASIAVEMEYLRKRPNLEWFRKSSENDLFHSLNKSLDAFDYKTIVRLLSFTFMPSPKRPYFAPRKLIVKRLLSRLKIEDLQFFLEHTEDALKPYLEFERDMRTEHDYDARSITWNKPLYIGLRWRSKLLRYWWDKMEAAERRHYIQDILQSPTVGALCCVLDVFKKVKEPPESMINRVREAFYAQFAACLYDIRKKQEFAAHSKNEGLIRLAASYLATAEVLELAEVEVLFELLEGDIFCTKDALYRACFGRTLTLDPEIISFLLKRYREQDHKKFTDGKFIFSTYLEQRGLQWDTQTEEVLTTFDQVYAHSDYEYTYSSYFHQGNSCGGKGVVLDDAFTRALFEWITAMEKYRKQRILNWIFAVWSDFNAVQFSQFYGCYLDTKPPQEDLDYVHKRFCEDYARKYDFQLDDYEGMADDPRAKILLECAKEFRPKYIEEQKRYNEASAAHLRQAIGDVSKLVNGQSLDDSD